MQDNVGMPESRKKGVLQKELSPELNIAVEVLHAIMSHSQQIHWRNDREK